jgi:hypothetical protein
MRKLIALPLFLFPLACHDASPVEADLSPDEGFTPIQLAERHGDAVNFVPFKAYGTWTYGPWGDLDCASDDGSTRERHIILDYHPVTHLGKVSSETYQCAGNNPWGIPVLWAQEVMTAANGDQLFIFNPGSLPPALIPEGSLWGMYVEFTGGTGRFANATGDGILHGTLDFVTMVGEFWIDAMISSVGSAK